MIQSRKIQFVILFCSMGLFCISQNTIQKRLYVPKSNNAYSWDITETTPGNFVLIGPSFDTVGVQVERKLSVMGVDNSGNVLWHKKYGNNKFYYVPPGGYYGMFKKHNGFLYAATMGRDSNNVYPGIIMKLNFNGDTLWQKKIYDSNPSTQYFLSAIYPSVDNGLLITGAIQTNTPGFNNHPIVGLYLLKTDINGNTLWEKRIYKSNLDKNIVGCDVVQDYATHKIIVVTIEEYDSGANGSGILFFDSLGTKLKQISNLYDLGLSELIKTSDGNFLVGGIHDYPNLINGYTTTQGVILKFDIDGKVIFKQEYDTLAIVNGFTSLIELPNGDIIGGGGQEITAKYTNGINEVCKIMRFDKHGNLLWKKYFDNITDNSNNDRLAGMCLTSNNQIAFTSYCDGSLVSPVTFMFYRTDTSYCDVNAIGCYSYSTVGVKKLEMLNEKFKIYPNPADGFCTLKFTDENFDSPVNLELRNVLGELVFKDKVVLRNEYRLNTFLYASGLYFIEIYSDEGILGKRKLMIER